MRTIKTVGVVGAGTMGAALAQKFSMEGLNVMLADRTMAYTEKGMIGIKNMLDEGVARKVFSKEKVEEIVARIHTTDHLSDLKKCDLVIEAIFENFDAKCELLRQLSVIVDRSCFIATNTSSFSVSELAAHVSYPDRFIGLHFFYHAAKNRLVEIIPGKLTATTTVDAMYPFSFVAGKDAITCADQYGFVVNRFFVPWLNESTRLLAENAGTIEEIDAACRKAFGITMGPFALMNATGVPVAYHAEKTLEKFGELYSVSEKLKVQAESNQVWKIDENASVVMDESKEMLIRDRMLGVIFFIATQLLDEKVCSATAIDRGALIGLKWKKGPVSMMKDAGEENVRRLIASIAERYKMHSPQSIGEQFWKIDTVTLRIKEKVACITMDQPPTMNALSEETMEQLNVCFTKADSDPSVETIFITGSGKAFVAGADIRFFLSNMKANRIDKIEKFTAFGQELFERIDRSRKKVVALVNGLALGGGLELALCADVILALPKAAFAFPETGIGIYPGLGGTQRSARRLGKGLSKYLVHTGKMLSAKEACEIGLVDAIISTEEMFQLLNGETGLRALTKQALPQKWTALQAVFEKNPIEALQNKLILTESIGETEGDKIARSIASKAPVALRLADQLIEEAKGCSSELLHLREIFSTEDALLGLSSIGKKVSFSGK